MLHVCILHVPRVPLYMVLSENKLSWTELVLSVNQTNTCSKQSKLQDTSMCCSHYHYSDWAPTHPMKRLSGRPVHLSLTCLTWSAKQTIKAKSNLMIPKSSKFSLPQLTTLQEPTSVKLIHFGILINSNPIKLSDSWLDTTLNLYFIQIHVQCGRLDINPQSEEPHLFSNQSLSKKKSTLLEIINTG